MSIELTQSLKQAACDLGFQLAGCCPAVSPPGFPNFLNWLEAGYAGQMHYLEERRDAYRHPQAVLTGVKSLLMLGTHYSPTSHGDRDSHSVGPKDQTPQRGRVARYASGEFDYHQVIWERLNALGNQLVQWKPNAQWRGVVDTAPLLEREFAQLAGLGWQGKNSLLINPRRGSYFFIAALLTDQVLDYDQPFATDHCGTCTACLDACPTQAFVAPQILDARRCISYLTIELREPIPRELRALIGDWVFGCDVCQAVCPWNRFAPVSDEPRWRPKPELQSMSLPELLKLTDDEFRQRFKQTHMWRQRRRGLLRNAAIALGNQRDPHSIPCLTWALADHEPLVRGAAAWALGQIISESSKEALENRLRIEEDNQVREEIEWALEKWLVE
jgi:epoxyqueuosine reductase